MSVWMRSLKFCLVITSLVISNFAYASANTDFQQGAKYFESGNYAKAVSSFESARRQGMKSTALYYNLGSSYYKLQQYDKAGQYFSILKKDPKMKSLAEYNLGLVSLKLADNEKANDYFKSVVRDNKDKKLVYLSKKQLKETPKSKKPWSFYSSAKLGHDNNINFAPAGTPNDQSDTFMDILLSADYQLIGTRTNGWLVNAAYAQTNFSDTNAFDQDQYGFGIKKTQKLNGWDTSLKLSFDQYSYSHDDYQSIMRLDARAKLKLSKNNRLYL